MIAISMIINGILTIIFKISIFGNGATHGFQSEDWIYVKPWTRMGAYFVGAVFGLAYFEYVSKEKIPNLEQSNANRIMSFIKDSRITSIILCIIGIGLTALYIFPLRSFFIQCGQNTNCWSTTVSFLYNFTSKPFFVLGLALVILPTILDRLRFIKYFLSNEPFAVLARLNYMVYMVHIPVIFWNIGDQRSSLYLNELNLWFFGIGTTVLSFFFAIPFTLLFEAPFLNIEKYILFPAPKKDVKSDTKTEELFNRDSKKSE
jgi:peptidoglycan/LPS O-acetylase OafA/YrhL